MSELLDRAAFEAWLAKKRPTETVGETCSDTSCPLAIYMHEALRLPKATVGRFWYRADVASAEDHELPDWAHAFVESIDGAIGDFTDEEPVSAAQALDVLSRVERAP